LSHLMIKILEKAFFSQAGQRRKPMRDCNSPAVALAVPAQVHQQRRKPMRDCNSPASGLTRRKAPLRAAQEAHEGLQLEQVGQ
jgi:hypothetical protein